jgi:subtilisin family serine protease
VSFVVSAGNSARAFDGLITSVPAAYPEVLTVTAMSDSDGLPGAAGGPPACRVIEADDAAARFSNWAATSAAEAHTVAAPGVCITSSAIGGGTAVKSGTSMATPHVAGVTALWWEALRQVPGNATSLSVLSRLLASTRSTVFAAGTDPADRGMGIVTAPLGLTQ